MKFFIFTLLLTIPFLLNAQDYNKFGIEKSSGSSLVPLEIGSKAPEFSGKDQFGNQIELSEMVEDGPVSVIFYRGYWCGICKRSLEEFQSEFSSLSSAGVQVVAVAPEVESNIAKTVNQNNLEFSVIKYFQTTLQEINGQNDAVLPIPATYLIDTNGKIKYVHFDIDYSKRATVKDILAKL